MTSAGLLIFCSVLTRTLCVIAPQIPDFKTGDKKVINGPFWHEVFTETYEDHEEDPSTTTSEPLPFFEDDASTNNVTAQLGSRVHLHCRVHDLGEKTISWVRRRGEELHLLSFGRHTYSADSRYSLAFEHPNDWRLLIQYVSERDEGFYECQISTHPPLVRRVHLSVVGDDGYPLEPWLMTPLKNRQIGTPERRYTDAHCSARNVVERCFGVLKSVFRCLSHQRQLMYEPYRAGLIINACAVLHNMRIKHRLMEVPEATTSTNDDGFNDVDLDNTVPKVEIVDERGRPLQDKFYKEGSIIELRCVVSEVPQPTRQVNWKHGARLLNYDTKRGGVSVKTEATSNGALSRLYIANANRNDSGNYTCSLADVAASAVSVHVLRGENPLAMQRGSAAGCSDSLLAIFVAFIS